MKLNKQLRKLLSIFKPKVDKDEDGSLIMYRKFNRQQLVGAIIRNGKKMYKVITNAELGGDGKRVTGEQELIEMKIR
jgi:hypothetical protein